VLSPNFEFLASEAEGEENEGIPGKVLVYLGISAIKATNKDIKKIVQKRGKPPPLLPSMTNVDTILQYTLQQGQTPPPSLNDQHGYRTSVCT